MTKVIIRGITPRGIKVIAHQREEEEKLRKTYEKVDKHTLPKNLKNFFALKSTFNATNTEHIIEGKLFTSHDHKQVFRETIADSFYSQNKSVIDIDFEVKFDE
jgi:glutaredoxin-related protein